MKDTHIQVLLMAVLGIVIPIIVYISATREELYKRTLTRVVSTQILNHSIYVTKVNGTTSTVKSNVTHLVNVSVPLTHVEQSSITVAIGMAITSKTGDADNQSSTPLELMPLFEYLLPSFCETASTGYLYHFYFAYDFNDIFFSKAEKLKTWEDRFTSFTKKRCKHLGKIGLHLVKCNYSGRPAWSQNDAMMAAYRDGRDFFYRVNDDTVMTTSKWTHIFISELRKMVPPLVGVVGPTHSGGYTAILTYDFVHRTHIDIFGFYYPREFAVWYADGWITKVYSPGYSKKLRSVRLRHIVRVTRYHLYKLESKYIDSILNKTYITLQKYLADKQAV